MLKYGCAIPVVKLSRNKSSNLKSIVGGVECPPFIILQSLDVRATFRVSIYSQFPSRSRLRSPKIPFPAKLHSMPEDFTPQPPPPPPPPSARYAAPPPYAPGYPPPYPPVGYGLTPPRRRSAWFYIGIIGGSFAAVCLLVTLMVWVTMRSVTGTGSAGLGLNPSQIAVIDISGVILSPEGINTELRKFGDKITPEMSITA